MSAETVWQLVDAPLPEELVPAVVALLSSESWEARHGAAAALAGASEAGRAAAAPALRELLERDAWVEAVLADIGPTARRALPALLELVREEADVVCASARRAVVEIEADGHHS